MAENEDDSRESYVHERVMRIAVALTQEDLDAFEKHILQDVKDSVPEDLDDTIHAVTTGMMYKVAMGEYDRAQELPDSELRGALITAYDHEMKKRLGKGYESP